MHYIAGNNLDENGDQAGQSVAAAARDSARTSTCFWGAEWTRRATKLLYAYL